MNSLNNYKKALDVEDCGQVFVCGHRASGGTLLMSLFDQHDELLVYPDESKFFYLFYPKMDSIKFTNEQKVQYLIDNNLKYLKNVLFQKCNIDESLFDFTSFIERFKILAKNANSWKDYLISIIQSFSEYSPISNNQSKLWVERTTSSEIYYLEIIKSFPDAKFIHNVRDPRDNYASLKSRWETKLRYLSDSDSLDSLRQSCIERCKLGLNMGLLNKKYAGSEKYCFSKYEDLVSKLDKSLNDISKFLNINNVSFNKNPTFCGVPWIGNNFSGKIFQGVSDVQVGKWKERITDYEAALMEFHFKDLMEIFGYKKEFSDNDQLNAAKNHYEWLNYHSVLKADLSLATKV